MKHLKEKDIGYWNHWWVAMRAGFGLLIHAWFPNLLPNYASQLICHNTESEDHKEKVIPCDLDHNGECLICDCWITECAYDRYLDKNYKYETAKELQLMFKDFNGKDYISRRNN